MKFTRNGDEPHMLYENKIKLKDDTECILRSPKHDEAEEVLRHFNQTHGDTDYLASYPEESKHTVEGEKQFLSKCRDSSNAIAICAYIENNIVGMTTMAAVAEGIKRGHRANMGISVEKPYWGKGIGESLTNACLECARKVGFIQMELEVVADNKAALSLYKKLGFTEYGRNPKGFRTKEGNWQELISMRLEL